MVQHLTLTLIVLHGTLTNGPTRDLILGLFILLQPFHQDSTVWLNAVLFHHLAPTPIIFTLVRRNGICHIGRILSLKASHLHVPCLIYSSPIVVNISTLIYSAYIIKVSCFNTILVNPYTREIQTNIMGPTDVSTLRVLLFRSLIFGG